MKKPANEKINLHFCNFAEWFLMRPYLYSVFNFRGEGLENIPQSGPAAVVCKHQSWVDIIAVFSLISRRMDYLAKFELFDNLFADYPGTIWDRIGEKIGPVTGRALELLGGMPLNRDNPAKSLSTFKRIKNYLTMGDIIIFFPEGRTVPGRMGEFKDGFMNMLVKMQAKMKDPLPFIPVGISFIKKKFGRTTLLVKAGRARYFKAGQCTATDEIKSDIEALTVF